MDTAYRNDVIVAHGRWCLTAEGHAAAYPENIARIKAIVADRLAHLDANPADFCPTHIL